MSTQINGIPLTEETSEGLGANDVDINNQYNHINATNVINIDLIRSTPSHGLDVENCEIDNNVLHAEEGEVEKWDDRNNDNEDGGDGEEGKVDEDKSILRVGGANQSLLQKKFNCVSAVQGKAAAASVFGFATRMLFKAVSGSIDFIIGEDVDIEEYGISEEEVQRRIQEEEEEQDDDDDEDLSSSSGESSSDSASEDENEDRAEGDDHSHENSTARYDKLVDTDFNGKEYNKADLELTAPEPSRSAKLAAEYAQLNSTWEEDL